MNDNTKPFWLSRTLWFNVIGVILIYAESQMKVIEPLVPASVYGWLVLVLPLGNLVLRAITNTALSMSAPKEPTP
jgi:hypothetical protein